MAKFLTSNTLIDSIKRRAMIPTNQSTFVESDFLEFANEELELGLVPSILSMHEEFLVVEQEIPLESGKSNYKIPSRAIGNKLRELAFKDNNNNVFEMTRITKDDLPDYQTQYNQGYRRTYYIQSNEIVLVPKVEGQVNGTLVFSFYIRPNELVSENRIATITGVNATTGDVTVSSVPDAFSLTDSTTGAPLKYDFIETDSPFVHLGFDKVPVSINSTTKVVNFAPADLPTDLEVGDHLALSYETKIPQVPADLHVVLAHRVAARCLEALGDTQGLANANQKLMEFEVKTGNVIDNRVEGAPLKVKNRNSILRQGIAAKRRRRRGRR